MDISDGVKILVDRLANNPEDFFGPLDKPQDPYLSVAGNSYPRFHHIHRILEDRAIKRMSPTVEVPRATELWMLSEEEWEQLDDAYLLARRERFTAEVIAALHTVPEPRSPAYLTQSSVIGGTVSVTGAAGQYATNTASRRL